MDLPSGWIVVESSTHPEKYYFYNTITRVSSWKKPEKSVVAPEQVGCKHILIKHKDVRNPKSKNPARKEEDITKTKEEAMEISKEIHQKLLRDPTLFEKLAGEESDCNSASRGGDLGIGLRGSSPTWAKAFEVVAFGLHVGELSGIFESPSGLHIALRTS